MNSAERPMGRGKQPIWITIIVIVVAVAGAWLKQAGLGHAPSLGPAEPVVLQHPPQPPASRAPRVPPAAQPVPAAGERTNDSSLLKAIRSKAEEANVEGSGRVVKLLPDDTEGLRHQRMLVAVADGGTILIAHNIDVATRIVAREGDSIAFKGIYIWNDRGGVVHWTHRDLGGRHPAGWVKVNGVIYQ